jgi:hypothetical protein
MAGCYPTLFRELRQYSHEPPVLVEDQHTLFIEAIAHTDRLKSEAHAAASFCIRCR